MHEIYCGICDKHLKPSNLDEVYSGENDAFLYIHDDIDHEEDKLKKVERENRLEINNLRSLQSKMAASQYEKVKLRINKECGISRRKINAFQATITRYKRAAH